MEDDKWGRLPLHIACHFRASADVLKLLLDSYPEAVRLADKVEGRLPLHYACIYGYPYDVSMLVAAEKRALQVKDIYGKTPVDLVNESDSPHKEAILKRITDPSKKAKRKKKEKKSSREPPNPYLGSPPMMTEPNAETRRSYLLGSPSEATLGTSNVTNEDRFEGTLSEATVETSNVSTDDAFGGKAKSVLPWRRNTKASENRPEFSKASSVGSLRKREPMEPRTRSSSLEKPKARTQRETIVLNCLPPDILESEPLTESSSLTSLKSRKKKRRGRLDSVPDLSEIRPSGIVAPSRRKIGRASSERTLSKSASLFLNDSVHEGLMESDVGDAPSVPRRKKKGLATNEDLMVMLDEEERKASAELTGHRSLPILEMPLTGSYQESKKASVQESGHSSMPALAPPQSSLNRKETNDGGALGDRKRKKKLSPKTESSMGNRKASDAGLGGNSKPYAPLPPKTNAPAPSVSKRKQKKFSSEDTNLLPGLDDKEADDSMQVTGHRSIPVLPFPRYSGSDGKADIKSSASSVPSIVHHSSIDDVSVLNTSADEAVLTFTLTESSEQSSVRSSSRRKGRGVEHESEEQREVMSMLNSQLQHMALRKAALLEECTHVNETIATKRAKAEMSRSKIAALKKQMREIQEALGQEQASLDFAETSVQLHQELLIEHEAKINAANEELKALNSMRDSLQNDDFAALEVDEDATDEMDDGSQEDDPDMLEEERALFENETDDRLDENNSAALEENGASTDEEKGDGLHTDNSSSLEEGEAAADDKKGGGLHDATLPSCKKEELRPAEI